MTIEHEMMVHFKLKLKHGDIERIRALSFERSAKDPNIKPVSRNTISNALNTGKCNDNTYDNLKAYYEKVTTPIIRIHETDGN